MKKLKIFSILLLLVSTAAFVAFKMYKNVIIDSVPPVVMCNSEEITVSVEATEEELLSGVKARDNRSGDVSDTLVIEKLSAFSEDGKRVATYAAVDDSMNVGRCEQTIIYEGYQPPRFKMNSSLCFSMKSKENLLSAVSAESVLDGDLTDNIKYSLPESINTSTPGNYPIEYRVMDNGGKVVYLNTYVEVCESQNCAFDVHLNEYLVYMKTGEAFSPDQYYAGAEREGALSIQSNVDTQTAGTYYVDYVVSSGSVSGKARLVVVVE